MNTPRSRVWITNAVVALVSTCAALLFSEMFVRTLFPQLLGLWDETRDGMSIHRPNRTVTYLNHEVHINSWGMRDREHSVKKRAGTFRILLLGDSFMEALQIPFDESFPKLLEDRLRESGSQNVEVISAAVSGWGTEDELAYLVRYGKRLQPDLILVAMTLHNDVSDNLRERSYTLNEGRLEARPVRWTPAADYLKIQIKSVVASHSQLFQLWRKYWYRGYMEDSARLLNYRVANLLLSKESETMAKGWQLTFQEFAAIQKEGRSIGAETAVMLIPISLQLSESRILRLIAKNTLSRAEVIERKPQDRMIKFGASRGIAIIDLLPAFKEWEKKTGEQLYLEGDGHWNKYGHRVAANISALELNHHHLLN
jgi:acetyltransferase AlgX (SGNH hydrolase-like protein)